MRKMLKSAKVGRHYKWQLEGQTVGICTSAIEEKYQAFETLVT
jgi:hypothetical protein